MSASNGVAWGQLVCTSDPIADTILISKDKFVIGRSKGTDLSLVGNKLVSGSHCLILKGDGGVVWLKDTSSNGTLLNYKTKLNSEKASLKHGDEFHLVYKKDETHLNVSYMYQDLEILRAEEEEEATQEYSDLDTSSTHDDPCSAASSPIKEATKRRHMSNSEDNDDAVQKKAKVDADVGTKERSNRNEREEADPEAGPSSNRKSSGRRKVGVEETETKHENIDIKQGKTGTKDLKTDEEKMDTKENDTERKEDKKETEGMEDDLICIICQEILHDCISCQPCLHCFCAGCYSDWMKRSNECPACRVKVDRVNKNHMVNKVVATFLKEHPTRKRPQAELDELDNRNKINKDSVKPRPPKRTMSDWIDDEDEDSNAERESEEEDENDPDYDPGSGLVTTSPFGSGVLTSPSPGFFASGMTGMFGTVRTMIRPPKTVCRQCPEYKDDGTSLVATAATAISTAFDKITGGRGSAATSASDSEQAGPSTATTTDPDAKRMPAAPIFKCPDTQVHLMCQCCLKPMPDRRTGRLADESIPHQQCPLCFRMFCHMYWGCQKDECLGCLARFKDMNFGKKILSTLVLENNYESEVLKSYLEEQEMSTCDLLKDCCVRMEAGDYTTADQVRGFAQNTVTCFSCGLRNFHELAYQYRVDVPDESLPTAARSRSNCYWGKECRTQKKMAHAVRFNHICEKSRTS